MNDSDCVGRDDDDDEKPNVACVVEGWKEGWEDVMDRKEGMCDVDAVETEELTDEERERLLKGWGAGEGLVVLVCGSWV